MKTKGIKRKRNRLLIDLLIQWGNVFYYRGGFNEYEALLRVMKTWRSLWMTRLRLGMFYAWLGWAKFWRAKHKRVL